ncbi:MAG: tape measure protein, partial [Sphingomonadales bacterium]|nr:tape measure protein [Sphingomonadales bacterium]
ALGRLNAALGAVSAVALARTFLSIADASKQMDAQLRLATQTFGTFTQAQADSQRIAAEARAGLTETVSLYGSFVRTASEIGRSQNDAARATETFSKALKIGGAGQAQVASATLQMGQALASANVQWEELGQILEASPRLAKVFTDSLGVTRAELKKMAEDGKLSGKQLFDALNNQRITAGIDTEFKTLPVTFDDSMQQIRNAAVLTFGAFDRGGEFSTALANFAAQGAEDFQSVASSAEQTGIDIRAVFDGLGDAFQPMVDGARSAFETIGVDSRSLAEQIRGDISTLLGLWDRFRNLDIGAERAVRQAGNALVRGGVLKKEWYYTPDSEMPGYADAQGRFNRGEAASRRLGDAKSRRRQAIARLEKAGYTVPIRPDGSVDEANVRRAPTRLPPVSAPSTGGGKKKGPKGPSAETLANRAEAARQRELRNDESFESEKAALNADLLRARQAIATAAETIAQYELEEIEAQRARQNASYQRDVSEKRLTQARADELIALNDKVAIERANVVQLREEERKRAEKAAVEAGDLQNARDLAAAEGALAETSQDRRRSALRLLDLEYQMERARLEAILASQQATEAEKEIARRRLAILPQLQKADEKAAARDTESPLERYRRRVNPTKAENRERVEELVVAELDQVRDGISDAISDRLGVKDPLLKGLLDMFIERVIMRPLADAFAKAQNGEGGGVFGTVAGAVMSLSGRASGGYVGAGQMVRVNEGASPGRVEGFRPLGAGHVIPLGQMNAVATRGGGDRHFHISVDARNSVTPASFASQISREVLSQAAQMDVEAGKETLRAAPGYLRQSQRQGAPKTL